MVIRTPNEPSRLGIGSGLAGGNAVRLSLVVWRPILSHGFALLLVFHQAADGLAARHAHRLERTRRIVFKMHGINMTWQLAQHGADGTNVVAMRRDAEKEKQLVKASLTTTESLSFTECFQIPAARDGA